MKNERVENFTGDRPVNAKRSKGMAEKWVFFACAAFSIVAVFGIVLFILIRSIPAFAEIGFFRFLFFFGCS